jgi:hypothetical protein
MRELGTGTIAGGDNILVNAMISCKNCGKEFRLRAVRINSEQSLKTDTFSNVNEVCPNFIIFVKPHLPHLNFFYSVLSRLLTLQL